jgi:hypothetical protein
MKTPKSKVISVRVNKDVADIIENLCSKENISKNEFLSKVLTHNFNTKKDDEDLSNLEKLLFKLRRVVPIEYFPVLDIETPAILKGTDYDSDYEGDIILVGDDTEIRENNGKFYVFDYHYKDLKPILMHEQEIIDFYAGQYSAYGVPSIEGGHSYHFVRGYFEVMNRLMNLMEQELEMHKKQFKI